MEKIKNLLNTNVTWGGYLKLCGWSFLISMICVLIEYAWLFDWVGKIKEFFNKKFAK